MAITLKREELINELINGKVATKDIVCLSTSELFVLYYYAKKCKLQSIHEVSITRAHVMADLEGLLVCPVCHEEIETRRAKEWGLN